MRWAGPGLCKTRETRSDHAVLGSGPGTALPVPDIARTEFARAPADDRQAGIADQGTNFPFLDLIVRSEIRCGDPSRSRCSPPPARSSPDTANRVNP